MAGSVQAPSSRDVLLLDIALDNYLRTLLERQDKGALGGDDLCELIALSLRNAVIAIDSEDLRQVRRCPSCTHYVIVSTFPDSYSLVCSLHFTSGAPLFESCVHSFILPYQLMCPA